MNRNLLQSFLGLRVSERMTVLQHVGTKMTPQALHESNNDFSVRCLRQIESDGTVRELEQAMLRFQ